MKHGTFDDVSVHMLDDAALLYDRSRRAMFTANLNAGTIWRGLEHQLSPREVADALTEEFGLQRREARHHVATTLWQWRQWCREADLRDATATARPRTEAMVLPIAPSAPIRVDHYRVLDTRFTLRFADGVPHGEASRVLRHLGAGDSGDGEERIFDIVRFGAGYAVAEEGTLRQSCERAEEVVAMIKAAMAECAIEDADAVAAVHAAAVARNGHCVLMPGRSGSGKSCLSAALSGSGFTLMGDDTVVLAPGDLAVRPVPFGVAIKDSAPATVTSRFPGLADRTLCARPDGKRIRYLTPPDIAAASADDRVVVSRIVFPRYFPGGETQLIPVSDGNCLERLLGCFAPLGDTMERRDVDRLVRWISETPSYVLHVSSLSEATRILNKLTE